MISKILASAAFTTVAGRGLPKTSRTPARAIPKRIRNQADDFPETNEALTALWGYDDDDCLRSVNRLKQGPADIDSIIQRAVDDPSYHYTDESFTGKETLYWEHFAPDWKQRDYDSNLASGEYFFARWPDLLPENRLFVGPAHPTQALQGEAGTCYIISSLATVAELPGEIESLFYTLGDNPAGIYGVKFFVRGKPWMVDIDDEMLFMWPTWPTLKFAKPGEQGAMWGSLLEKAWAKVKGSYENAEAGYVTTGIRALTGAPGFGYYDLSDVAATFSLIAEADAMGYLVGAGTSGQGDHSIYNECGIAQSHAYTIAAAFTMSDGWNEYDMLIVRNPWGSTGYSGEWNHADSRWTDDLLAQVPFGLDPRTSHEDGIFFAEKSIFYYDCFSDVTITHFRDDDGYADTWYDAIDMDEQEHSYYFTVPSHADGSDEIYLTVESYYQDVIPNECTTGIAQGMELQNPLVLFEFYEENSRGSWRRLDYNYYVEGSHTPMLLQGLDAGGEYRVGVTYEWLGSPAPDYTVKLYSPFDLTLVDDDGATHQLHTDGQQPSEFVNQWEGEGHEHGVDGHGADVAPPAPQPIPEPDDDDFWEPEGPSVASDVVTISGAADGYNGDYLRGHDWQGEPHFQMGDKHFYYLPGGGDSGYWQLDDRDQELFGYGDYYRGGYLYANADLSDLDGNCWGWSNGATVCIDVHEGAAPAQVTPAFSISGHPDGRYNGDYFQAEDWNGWPHYTNANGCHLYYYCPGQGYQGYWQLDDRDQDGSRDYYGGGYLQWGLDDRGWADLYDANGAVDLPFGGVGDLRFQRGEGAVQSGPGETITISGHWDWQYDGVYYRGEDWGGHPHFEHEDGTHHLYHYGCYWQLDDREQDGSSDWYRGGYYYNCDDEWTTNLDVDVVYWGDFEHGEWPVAVEHGDAYLLSAVASLQQKPEPYSGLQIASFAIIAVAILAGIRQMMKNAKTHFVRQDNMVPKAHEESLVGSEPIPA